MNCPECNKEVRILEDFYRDKFNGRYLKSRLVYCPKCNKTYELKFDKQGQYLGVA